MRKCWFAADDATYADAAHSMGRSDIRHVLDGEGFHEGLNPSHERLPDGLIRGRRESDLLHPVGVHPRDPLADPGFGEVGAFPEPAPDRFRNFRKIA
jgi:hypothetical protein